MKCYFKFNYFITSFNTWSMKNFLSIVKTSRVQKVYRSIKRPIGIFFDVLLKVDKFILPMDFMVLDCEMDQDVPIILGRPLLATGRAIVDIELGEMKFRVHKDEFSFKICKSKKQTVELQVVSVVDVENEKINKE